MTEMSSNKKPPAARPPGTIDRPEDEVVWVKCRASKTCEGNRSKVLLKKNEGLNGTWIQYQCLTCKRPFGIRC